MIMSRRRKVSNKKSITLSKPLICWKKLNRLINQTGKPKSKDNTKLT